MPFCAKEIKYKKWNDRGMIKAARSCWTADAAGTKLIRHNRLLLASGIDVRLMLWKQWPPKYY